MSENGSQQKGKSRNLFMRFLLFWVGLPPIRQGKLQLWHILRNDAWAGYGGGTLYTRSKKIPPEIMDRVREATAKAKVPYDQYWKAQPPRGLLWGQLGGEDGVRAENGRDMSERWDNSDRLDKAYSHIFSISLNVDGMPLFWSTMNGQWMIPMFAIQSKQNWSVQLRHPHPTNTNSSLPIS